MRMTKEQRADTTEMLRDIERHNTALLTNGAHHALDLADELESVNIANAELRRALGLLVAAKDRKDTIGKDAEYERMKDAAWDAARALLAGEVQE